MFLIKKYLYIVFIIIFCITTYSQTKEVFVYNIERGLPSNLIKSFYQDKNGFLWIGSDAGLVQFDGNEIVNYTHHIASHYVKDIKEFNDTTFIVVTDDDVYKVTYHLSVYNFKSISELYNQTDFFFDYPKKVFVDSSKRIWVGGLQSVFCIDSTDINTFNFDESEIADSYFRSFQFFEDSENRIYILSYYGSLFRFDENEKGVTLIDSKLNNQNRSINGLLKINDNEFIIGASDGLFLVRIINQKIEIDKIRNVNQVSSIVPGNDNLFYIGTWGYGVFSLNLITNEIKQVKEVSSKSIKSLFVDDKKTLWAATDEGAIHVKRKIFHSVDIKDFYPGFQNLFVRASSGVNSKFYFTDTQGLFESGFLNEEIFIEHLDDFDGNQIYSIAANEDFMWISFNNNLLVLYNLTKKKILYQTTFEDDRAANLFVDSKNNLWGYFERKREIIRIDEKKEITFFEIQYDDISIVNIFKESEDGKIYCSGRGESFYILQFDPAQNTFIKIEIENVIDYSGVVIVYDADIINNKLYLAANSGLFYFYQNRLNRIKLPEPYDKMPVKSVSLIDENRIWIGTDIGLVHINKNAFAFFNKLSGLSNSTIAPKGLYSDKNGNLWIGTASGVSFFKGEYAQIENTTAPFITGFSALEDKGEKSQTPFSDNFLYGRTLEINFVSINFPAFQVRYSHRIIGYDTTWSEYTSGNSIILPLLPVGNYKLEIKAQANGLFESSPSSFSFSIVPPWYLSVYAYIVYVILFILFIAAVSWIVSNYKIRQYKKREAELTKLVDVKTKDLQSEKFKTEQLLQETEKSRAELERANELKNQLLSVAAHDLKNPLNSVMCFSSIILEETKDEEVKTMAEMINGSSHKMLQLIIDLLEGAALQSKDIKLSIKPVNVGTLIQKVVNEYSIRAEQKKQIIESSIPDILLAEVDSTWFTHALENILSNAVKYSPNSSNIYVSCKEESGNILISVKDNGPGFTDEDKQLLFGKFQRLSAKPTGGETSTGLGLSIVKDIIEKHNGKVWVESEAGKGSNFIISIPVESRV